MSLDAGAKVGSLTTESFILNSPWLYANVDAARGSFRVEALDAEGVVLARSGEITGDHQRYPIQWESDALQARLHRPVRLRFSLQNAAFYSYWLEELPAAPPR